MFHNFRVNRESANPGERVDLPRKRATLNVDLGEFREPFIAQCAVRAERPSSAVRRLIVRELSRGSGGSGTAGAAPLAGDGSSRTRVEVRFSEAELAAARAMALADGYPVNRWIGALVHARLVGGAQLGADELNALQRSNYELRAIGRNLNQAVRALQGAGQERAAADLAASLELLSGVIDVHLREVARVLRRNAARFRVRL